MFLKSVLAFSIVVNLGLLFEFVWTTNDSQPSVQALRLAHEEDGLHEFFDSLAADEVLSERQKKILFLDRIFEGNEPNLARDYWRQNTFQSDTRYLQPIRSHLLEFYGPDSKQEALFKRFFYPLETEIPGLVSEKQIALQLLLTQRSVLMAELGQQAPISSQKEIREILLRIEGKENDVRALLDEDEYHEYGFRLSELSMKLASLGLELSETQFRSLYSLIKMNVELENLVLRKQPSMKLSIEVYDANIETILGIDNYVSMMKRLDPIYGMMKGYVERNELSMRDVDYGYTQFLTIQTNISKLDPQADEDEISMLQNELNVAVEDTFGQPMSMILSSLLSG